ncbi:hypothetical protein RB653_006905 [Dictyostelium firmibasis]|uniref:Ribosomal RNA-processing protein 7 C-terminal domain-containing protein n=1 Tax=Dictyostelium firmibasis TaxID=79012 RepID=A0AAN7TTR6_9MYCE
MVIKSKAVKNFTLKKKSVETTSLPIEESIENDSEDINETSSSSSPTVTKSILKKKKVEKVEKKKVIIQTEKNQTQLFNKTLKISDKPLIIKPTTTKKEPKPTPPLVKQKEQEKPQQQQQEKEEEKVEVPIIEEKQPTNSSNKKVSTTKNETTTKESPKTTTTTTEKKQTTDKKNKKITKNEKPIIEELAVEQEPNQVIGEEEESNIVVEEEKPKIVKETKTNNNNNNKKKKKQVVESESDSDSDSSDDEIIKKKEKKEKKENTISGFTILPVQIENSTFKKYIYIKKETNKKWPQNKTLFVTNLPTHCQTLEDVKKLFKYDFIESVHFGQPNFKNNDNNTMSEDNSSSSSEQIDESTKHVAHIVMKDQDSLKLFLKKSHSLSIQQPSLPLNGFNQLLNQYNSKIIRNYDELQTKLDNIMMDYDKRVLESKKRSKLRNVPDEEGFITVGPSSAKVMTAEEVKALMEKKQKKNFYAFQHRQTKKDELDVLRQKFEEDKQRISKITATRKFKPY